MSVDNILKRQREAKNILEDICATKSFCLLIHYSCESFYDKAEGTSARITSIAVRNLANAQTKSFSIHQYAEHAKISGRDIATQYDKFEKKMLDAFYSHVKKCEKMRWIHWNMRDINYGFEAIAHRYRVLGGKPSELHPENLIDLARLLIGLYSPKYIGHPRLEKLMYLNRITAKDFLSGKDEAIAFDNQEYVKLHQSTLRKVDIFANIIGRIEDGSLKTNMRAWERFKLYPQLYMEKICKHWIVSFLCTLATIAGFICLFF